MNTTEKLDRLAQLNGIVEDSKKRIKERTDFYLEPFRAEIEKALKEHECVLDSVQDEAACLKRDIDAEVLNIGATVKGDVLMAVYTKGRESWDGKKLSGYALAHPEILEARKVGKPSVSLRAVKAQ